MLSFLMIQLSNGVEISLILGQGILLINGLRSTRWFCLSVLKDFCSSACLSSVSHLSHEISQIIFVLFFYLLFCPGQILSW